MGAYYNEHDPYTAEWLRNLIAAGHIAPGEVDTRSIEDVTPDDLQGFQQCHFFAGIGIWSRALRDAGWPDDRMAWTGSCPCQPFSAAGKRAGFADERHLWPAWAYLIGKRKPPVIFGEQVASALDWFDLVSADLENEGYAVGAADLCAAGFSGAHIRQRLYFVGMDHAAGTRRDGPLRGPEGDPRNEARLRLPDAGCSSVGLADDDAGSQGWAGVPERRDELPAGPGSMEAQSGSAHAPMLGRHAVDWLYCRDAKWRPVEPGTFPLADAAPGRVGRLRAYGNGLDLETATGFVGAVMDALGSS